MGGRVVACQPVRGYRSGADAVMLAAACPARAGDRVLELGCGAGVALLCLGARVGGLSLWGVERSAGFAALARENMARQYPDGQKERATIIQGDITAMPAPLRAISFDHVIANPPYFRGGTLSPDTARAQARSEDAPLGEWIRAGLRRIRPGGSMTVIQRADRLGDILSHAATGVTIRPIAARHGREAGRVLVQIIKGRRAGLRLLAPFIMHDGPRHSDDRADLSPAAEAILRHAAPLDWG